MPEILPHFLYAQDLVQGFDQEVAAVVMARLASYKMEMEVVHVLYLWPKSKPG